MTKVMTTRTIAIVAVAMATIAQAKRMSVANAGDSVDVSGDRVSVKVVAKCSVTDTVCVTVKVECWQILDSSCALFIVATDVD